jgi:IS605 OrfB family transposase
MSARLYNVAIYNVRQHYQDTQTSLSYESNYHIAKENENYIDMPSAVAQQTLKCADRSFRTFFGLLKAKRQSRYHENVGLPKYLKKGSYYQLIFPNNAFRIKNKKLVLGMSRQAKKNGIALQDIDIPYYLLDKKIVELRLVPKYDARFFELHIVYEVELEEKKIESEDFLSVDIGLNNLATCYDSKNNRAFIVDGRYLKSINYWYNKETARLQSIKDKQKIKGFTKKQCRIAIKRNNRVKDYMIKTAIFLANYCIKNNLGKLIIGHNKGMKQEIHLGKTNNQNFVQIPFGQMYNQLEYRCKINGIRYISIEESHTSKCSCLDNEEVKHYDQYLGKRIKRGLFKSSKDILVNADVNGAINISRKVTGMTVMSDQIKGIVSYPVRLQLTKIPPLWWY